MPSDTRTESVSPRFELRLPTLVVSVFVVLVGVISLIVLISGYQIARRAIEADVDRHRDGTQQIAVLVVNSWLQDVRQLLELTVNESALNSAMSLGDVDAVRVHLASVFYSREEGAIDVLFAHLVDDNVVVDVGALVVDPAVLRQVAIENRAFVMNDRVVAIGDDGTPEFVVLSRRDVIDPVTGRVLGALYGGFALNENVSLLSAFNQAAGAAAAAFEIDGRLTAPVSGPGVPADQAKRLYEASPGGDYEQFRSALPLTYPADRPLHLVSSHSLRAVDALGQSYRAAILGIVASVLAVSAVGAWLLHQLTLGASGSLTSYVAEVNRRNTVARFRKTAVREFNEVGTTLSHFVTALRESEERALAILNNASTAITIKSADGHYAFVNREFEVSMALSSMEVVGQRSEDIFPPDIAEMIERSDRTVIEMRTHAQFEASMEIEGIFRAFLITKFPLIDSQGSVTSVCSFTSDITPLKLSEMALTEALAAAENASQSKSRFLATMSHEFRTPLNAILGFSEMIRGEFLGPVNNPTYRAYADDIHNSGRQMLDLVDEILDTAAVEAGQRQFDSSPVDVAAAIGEAIKQFERSVAEKGLSLIAEEEGTLPVIRSDQRAVLQVLQNLLSNAVKFTRSGGTVRVCARAMPDAVEIEVCDTGVGMSADVVRNVTEPFFQDKSDPHLAEAGTGLGLSIVKSIVDGIGGTLAIESEPSKGTRVTVRLPIKPERSEDD